MLHGLEVRVLRISDIPNSDDGISTRSVKPVQVGIVLKRVHPGPVTSLTFLSDDKRHLQKNNGAFYPQSYNNNIETKGRRDYQSVIWNSLIVAVSKNSHFVIQTLPNVQIIHF